MKEQRNELVRGEELFHFSVGVAPFADPASRAGSFLGAVTVSAGEPGPDLLGKVSIFPFASRAWRF